jgi:hypothetical protein
MDDTTPPVTKIYLVSLIYTPKKKAPTQHPHLLYESERGKRVRRR